MREASTVGISSASKDLPRTEKGTVLTIATQRTRWKGIVVRGKHCFEFVTENGKKKEKGESASNEIPWTEKGGRSDDQRWKRNVPGGKSTVKEGFFLNLQRKKKKVKNESRINDGNLDCLEDLPRTEKGTVRRRTMATNRTNGKGATSTKDCSESSTAAFFENREGESKGEASDGSAQRTMMEKGSALEEALLRIVDDGVFKSPG